MYCASYNQKNGISVGGGLWEFAGGFRIAHLVTIHGRLATDGRDQLVARAFACAATCEREGWGYLSRKRICLVCLARSTLCRGCAARRVTGARV